MSGWLMKSRWFWRESRAFVGSAQMVQWVRAYARFMWFSRHDCKEIYR